MQPSEQRLSNKLQSPKSSPKKYPWGQNTHEVSRWQHSISLNKHVEPKSRAFERGFNSCRNHIEINGTSLNALMPFLFLETEMGIVFTAALDFAMIPKPPDDDPVGRPRRLIADLQAGMGRNKGALLGGLVVLGGRRVNALL